MVYKFIPFRSGVHRVAGIALFRALLIKCRNAPLRIDAKEAIQNVVRHRFRENSVQCSKRILYIAFREGYEAIDLLDAATAGSEESVLQIQQILDGLPPRMKQSATSLPSLEKPGPSIPKQPDRPRPSVHLRPYRNVTGVRQVPRLVTRGPLPFLRMTKPQPFSLTGHLAHVQKTRDKRVRRGTTLRDRDLPVAQREDEWDQILGVECPGLKDEEPPGLKDGRNPWTNTLLQMGIETVDKQLKYASDKRYHKALALWEIQKKEQILADMEREQRKTETRIRALARRLEPHMINAEPNAARLSAKKQGLEKKLQDTIFRLERKKDELCIS